MGTGPTVYGVGRSRLGRTVSPASSVAASRLSVRGDGVESTEPLVSRELRPSGPSRYHP